MVSGLLLVFSIKQHQSASYYKELAVDSIVARGGQLVAIESILASKYNIVDSNLIRDLAGESLFVIKKNEIIINDVMPPENISFLQEMIRNLSRIAK